MKASTPLFVFSSLLILLANAAHAEVANIDGRNSQKNNPQNQWGQCSANKKHNGSIQHSALTTITAKPSADAIYLEADSGTVKPEGVSSLNGNVIIQQNDTQFNADNASFDRRNNLVIANGRVILKAPNLEFKSNAITYNLKDKTGTIDQAEYKIGKNGARGDSQKIELINKDELKLKDATFSSCPALNPSWHIKSSEIKLNKKTQVGSARDVTFNVGGTPVFYFPKFSFPLNNDRKSGFLSPNIKLQTNAGISLPYYFNLAPNYDATVVLSTHERQGFEIDTEFRYLTSKHQGIINYDYIPQDKSFKDKRRDYFNFEHRTTVSKETKINLNAEGVSDEDYFNDLSDSLETSSRSSLQRRLEVVHKNSPWTISAAVEDYQILDIEDSPYAKLPELKLGYRPKTKPQDLKLKADIEVINFEKSDSVTGTRLDTKLSASKKWGDDAWFIKPTLSLQSTHYSLQNTIGESSLNRTLPTLSLDGGLFFDREFIVNKKSGSRKYVQTLEPRMLYSYTPFKNQDDFPVFDTARTNFSATNQLFSKSRFTGKDRIADTNQLTFAVTSRLQDRENGRELLRASIGQVFNYSDRKVTLPNGTIQTGRRSDLVLELSGRLNENFKISSTALWNYEKKALSNYELRLNYQDAKKRIANISYRELDADLNASDDSKLSQLAFSTALPINNKWSFVGSIEHDIENDRNLETLAGFEYQDCCWKTRIVAKRFLNSDNETYDTPIFIEFELKGLGSLGSAAKRELKEKIYGYDDY